MHVREVDPDEERLVRLVLALDEVGGALRDVVVDRFHPLLVSGPVSSIFCVPSGFA